MTKFAAYDDLSIHATGDTPDLAIANAREKSGNPEAQFKTARMSEMFAAWVDQYGWDRENQCFSVEYGVIHELSRIHPKFTLPHKMTWQDDPRPLTECLAAFRQKHGWTRNDLAAQLCTSRSTLDGWLAGRACRHEAMVRLVMALLDDVAAI